MLQVFILVLGVALFVNGRIRKSRVEAEQVQWIKYAQDLGYLDK